ncbi:MAG: Crp/Fnr family transcriptional regulator [Nitrospinae bacterium]|nr:Crp/Fnr family transcriptional regulator [Nitrospinota bacterium]
MGLKNFDLFKSLSEEEFKKFDKMLIKKSYQKNEMLFDEGKKCNYLWLVLEGEVKIFKAFPSGKSAILGVFGKGNIVAEVPVIDNKPYPASCQAVTDCIVGKIKSEAALELMTSNPQVSLKIISGFAKRLRNFTDELGTMATLSVNRRLSRFLLKLSEKIGVEEERGTGIQLSLTRKDIAECIGSSFEVVVRCLGKLQKEGILEIDNKKVIILNSQRLQELVEE